MSRLFFSPLFFHFFFSPFSFSLSFFLFLFPLLHSSHSRRPPPLLLHFSSAVFFVHSYVEQLGTFMPIEAPQAGELVAFLVDEGNPVEYRQPVAEIAPFFGGHIIGDSKHA